MPEPGGLPAAERVLVVVAHPDDESFGLGALVAAFTARQVSVSVLCLTHGEASTLGEADGLRTVREAELTAAADVLGVSRVTLVDLPDGGLSGLAPEVVQAPVEAALSESGADLVLVFDPEAGVTGHPDHRAASLAAVEVARRHGVPTLGWALPHDVAATLNDEFAAGFAGHDDSALDITVEVDRTAQLRAVQCHASQAVPGSVLWRRLELAGDREHLRRLA